VALTFDHSSIMSRPGVWHFRENAVITQVWRSYKTSAIHKPSTPGRTALPAQHIWLSLWPDRRCVIHRKTI